MNPHKIIAGRGIPLDAKQKDTYTQDMPKRSSKAIEDINQLAASIVRAATDKVTLEKDPLAVELGRRGGLKGGKARAKKLSPTRRMAIAKKAAAARWAKRQAAAPASTSKMSRVKSKTV